MDTHTNEIERQVRELTQKEGSCWIGIFNQEDEQVHEHRFTANGVQPMSEFDERASKIIDNMEYLGGEALNAVIEVHLNEEDEDGLREMHDELLAWVTTQYGGDDSMIELPYKI